MHTRARVLEISNLWYVGAWIGKGVEEKASPGCN